MRKLIRIFMYSLILIFVVLNVIIVYSVNDEIFGLKTIKVNSKTMEPTIKQGNLIIYKEYDTYKEDDIIVTQNLDNLFVNRVYKINNYLVTTMNDNRSEVYEERNVQDIKGKVVFIFNLKVLLIYILFIFLILFYILADVYISLTPPKVEKKEI